MCQGQTSWSSTILKIYMPAKRDLEVTPRSDVTLQGSWKIWLSTLNTYQAHNKTKYVHIFDNNFIPEDKQEYIYA